MAITDLPVFQVLKSKMQWHQTRQGVLAENVANADTPGYRGQDLKAFSFEDALKARTTGLETSRTVVGHMHGSMLRETGAVKRDPDHGFEITPDGNTVALEEQMMKVTANQMDYQTVSSLYSKGLGLIRTALSRNG
ncbi:flagellar basal body rod protein FlgB [Stappia indica]|uniref:flagellar basal body rod protein FlgB n=1 Tax=Stappia indica TaxID=538381 RepID=UPI001CD5F66F|nr:flagellar basal body rod protein FlgB [Stappia indica]MCA1299943.1 flagellar basal body rod protein FlgB [Stappia indica]